MSVKNKKKTAGVGCLPAAVLIVVVVGAATPWLWVQTRPYESSAFADVSWSAGGDPGVFTCTVVDAHNNPIPDAEVSILSNSGWTPAVETDQQGCAFIIASENDVMGIRVNGRQVMSRPYAYWLNTPSVRRGLTIKVVIKAAEVRR